MDNLKAFGRNIRTYIKNLHLSQEELAEKLNINTSNIVKLEAGKQFVTAKVLFNLASILQVSVSDLFKETSPEDTSRDDSYKQKLLKYISTLSETEAKFAFDTIKLFQKYSGK